MPAFNSVHIDAFRGLPKTTLADCGHVNLIVGPNNCGKTSILEAMALLCRPDDLEWWIDTLWPREVKGARTPEREVLRMVFPHFSGTDVDELFAGILRVGTDLRENGNTVNRSIEAQIREQKIAPRDLDYFKVLRADGSIPVPPEGEHTTVAAQLSVSLTRGSNVLLALWHQLNDIASLPYPSATKENQIPCRYVTTVSHRTESLADLVSEAVLNDRKPQLLEILVALQPTITDFHTRTREGQRPQVWLRDSKAGWLPISVAGDGMRRAFHFAVAAVGATGGVLLIDEIESALHTSALSTVFGFLVRECAALGVQIFATTHSLEALDAIMGQSTESDSLVTYSLTPESVRRISLSDLRIVREEHGFDIR